MAANAYLFAVEAQSLDALDFDDGNPSALTSEDAQRLRFSRPSISSSGRTVKDPLRFRPLRGKIIKSFLRAEEDVG